MKPLIIIIVITAVIIVGGFLTLYALDSESERLDNKLSSLEQQINNQNWDAAADNFKEFHSKWDKVSTLWSMLIDHYEIDNIELVLSKLDSYIKTQDKTEALSQLSSLKTLVKHIPEKESFNFKNVL